ncbi:hypothetical protein [Streptomyces capparidis]
MVSALCGLAVAWAGRGMTGAAERHDARECAGASGGLGLCFTGVPALATLGWMALAAAVFTVVVRAATRETGIGCTTGLLLGALSPWLPRYAQERSGRPWRVGGGDAGWVFWFTAAVGPALVVLLVLGAARAARGGTPSADRPG